PTLFHELREQFGERLPGEANLRHHLIKKGFLPDRADDVIRTYKANLELVGSTKPEYDGEQEQDEMQGSEVLEAKSTPPTKTIMQGAMKLNVVVPSRTYAFDISIPRDVKGELRIIGEFG